MALQREARGDAEAGGANLIFEVEAASIEDGPQIIHLDGDTMPVYSEADTAFLEL